MNSAESAGLMPTTMTAGFHLELAVASGPDGRSRRGTAGVVSDKLKLGSKLEKTSDPPYAQDVTADHPIVTRALHDLNTFT